MYKVTLFLQESPNELYSLLSPAGFQYVKGSLIHKNRDTIFQIVPFRNRNPVKGVYGYRIYFSSEIVGLYVFEFLKNLHPEIKGVEYNLTEIKRSKLGWVFYLRARSSYKEVHSMGLFQKGNVFLSCVNDNHLNLQIRPERAGRTIPLYESIHEITLIKNEFKKSSLSEAS